MNPLTNPPILISLILFLAVAALVLYNDYKRKHDQLEKQVKDLELFFTYDADRNNRYQAMKYSTKINDLQSQAKTKSQKQMVENLWQLWRSLYQPLFKIN